MGNQKSSTSTSILLILFIILTVLLGVYLVYDKVLNKNEATSNPSDNINTPTQQENEKIYTYDGISGYYTAETKEEVITENKDNSVITKYSLYLYENGTFSFRWSYMAPVGFIGNYIIKENQIILNPLYDTNSGASKTKTTNSPTTLIINHDGTLETDGDTFKKITLSKTTDDSTENQFDHHLSYPED